MPIIRPISSLRNQTRDIASLCHEQDEPVFLTTNKVDDPDQIGGLQNHHSENRPINFGLPGGWEGENGRGQDDDGFNTRAAGLDIGRELRRNDKRPGDVCFRTQEL